MVLSSSKGMSESSEKIRVEDLTFQSFQFIEKKNKNQHTATLKTLRTLKIEAARSILVKHTSAQDNEMFHEPGDIWCNVTNPCV